MCLSFFFLSENFPKLYARRCDTDVRFCQLNPLNGEAILEESHAFLLPSQLKLKFMNALMIYNRYTSPIAMDSITRIDILEDAVLNQSVPFKVGKELSSSDIENIFWLLNEYKRSVGNDSLHRQQFITPHQLYDFIIKMESAKIHRLKMGMSWAKIAPVIMRGMTQAMHDSEFLMKSSFRRVLQVQETQRAQHQRRRQQEQQQQRVQPYPQQPHPSSQPQQVHNPQYYYPQYQYPQYLQRPQQQPQTSQPSQPPQQVQQSQPPQQLQQSQPQQQPTSL